jgi:hypothetical protein
LNSADYPLGENNVTSRLNAMKPSRIILSYKQIEMIMYCYQTQQNYPLAERNIPLRVIDIKNPAELSSSGK